MPIFNLEAIPQTGHNCKIVAIAAIENYYAERFNFSPFPLHKAKINPFSIRQLAKKHGSVQGELLEITQIQSCLGDLGYESEILELNDFQAFQNCVQSQLEEENLLIAFFCVDRYSSFPSAAYDSNEHAAVIHGLVGKDLIYTHWNRRYQSDIESFFASSKALPTKRFPEYYQKINDRTKKYNLVNSRHYDKVSITPKENSGFRCKLVVVRKPHPENRNVFLLKRQQLVPDKKISKRELEAILNRYATCSWWRMFFAYIGLMNKESATILALRKLLNQPEDTFNQQAIKNQILDSCNQDWQKIKRVHSLFKSMKKVCNSQTLNTDEVIEEIKNTLK